MCGFLGTTNADDRFDQALDTLRHRGPDSRGVMKDARLAMGFRRLSIIDLSAAADQPMCTEDDQVWVVFNGEIYDFMVLRGELERLGHVFRTHSDTEVILKAYVQWGADLVYHIDGMFAIVIYDRRDAKIRLFRDRAGIKPLYYHRSSRGFVFASELKAVEHVLGREGLRVDPTALYDFLTYFYIPDPKTGYLDTFKLPPGHRLVYDLTSQQIESLERYWDIPSFCSMKTEVPAAAHELRELVDSAVASQLVADVPVGCFLSGGVDSSVIVASASRHSAGIHAFSMGFDDPRFDETSFAMQVAARCQVTHHTGSLSAGQTGDMIHSLKDWYDEPFADTSAIPTFFVSAMARQKVTVAVTGDGGDELFGGYKRYSQFFRLAGIPRLPCNILARWFSRRSCHLPVGSLLQKILHIGEMFFSGEVENYALLSGMMTRWQKETYRRLWGIPDDYDDLWFFRQYYRPELPVRTRLQYLDFHTYLPCDILTKVDRTSMAVSLEARVPFLSRKVIEFAFALPENIRFTALGGGWRAKGILLAAYADSLPEAVVTRRKMGFAIPEAHLPDGKGSFTECILRDIFGDFLRKLSVDRVQ